MTKTMTVCAALVLACLFALSVTAKGPGKGGGGGGGGGGETPAGTIYFEYGNEIWGMKADGSGQSKALDLLIVSNMPHFALQPSNLLYGSGHRWWLMMAEDGRVYDRVVDGDGNVTAVNWPHRELFAVRGTANGIDAVVQLTDTFGSISHTARDRDETVYHGSLGGQVWWSNDGLDSFASYIGYDVSAAFSIDENGVTTLDRSLFVSDRTFKVNIAGSDIDSLNAPVGMESIEDVGGFQRLRATEDWYHWGPTGQNVVFSFDNPLNNQNELWVANLASGDAIPLVLDSIWNKHPRWSPLLNAQGDTRIAFEYQYNIWTIDPATGDAGPLHLNKPTNSWFRSPCWSPDGTHVVFMENDGRGRGTNEKIGLLPATGATKHKDLTGSLDTSVRKRPIRWVSDTVVE